MVRPSSKKSEEKENQTKSPEPEAAERKRLKKLAFSKRILSDTPVTPLSHLAPSKTLLKHHGRDILRKSSQRKNRFLFSFPGLLAPVAAGGKIGDLKDLGSKNPVLYLHFPQGQMKLFGTIVYPKNKYLTLQFSRGGKNVMCEDYFDNMIVFSDAWWIGTKEENPEEAKLDFPKELSKGKEDEYDFKGGAGNASISNQVHRNETKLVEEESPETKLENDVSDDENSMKHLKEATPTRHSARTAGKSFKFAEVSSGDDSDASDVKNVSQEEEKKVKINTSSAVVLDIDDEATSKGNHSEQIQASAITETKYKNLYESSVPVATSKEDSHCNHGSLVQATISTLFKKVQEKDKAEDKKAPRNSRKLSSSKGSGLNLKHTVLKTNTDQAERPRKRAKVTEGKKAGTKTKAKKKIIYEDDEDDKDDKDIEEFSSSSQDTEGSDEDWAA